MLLSLGETGIEMPAVGRVGRRELEELVTRVQHGGRCHLVHAVLVRPTRTRDHFKLEKEVSTRVWTQKPSLDKQESHEYSR